MRATAARRSRPRLAGAAPATRLDLPDGGSAEVRGGALEVRDAEGRLRIRYEGGAAEIVAPDGDLRLVAPNGRVVIAAATEVSVEAERLSVRSRVARAVLGQVQVTARGISTTAERVAASAGEYEVVAGRVVSRSKEALREVTELAEERLGRVRTLVQEAFSLSARRTILQSEEETSIDGRRVLLG
jgi:hypothetical protein